MAGAKMFESFRRSLKKTFSRGPPRKLSADANELSQEKKEPLVVCFGEMLIDFVPNIGGVSLADAPGFKKAAGGAPANVAVGISRLGGSSAFIGKVGEDEFGHMLADILKQNNVDNSGMCFDPNARTALAFVTLRDDGEREFMFYRNPSADMLLTETELDQNLIKKASIFHFGSISLIDEPCRSAHLAAMDIAKKSGAVLSYDPNLRLPLWPSAEAAREGIMSIWDKADIIKINEDEIKFLTEGEDPYDDNMVMTKLFHPNLKLLLVTEGAEGCRYYTKEFKGKVGGVKVDAVDTTGAGDAFVGGVLNSLASDLMPQSRPSCPSPWPTMRNWREADKDCYLCAMLCRDEEGERKNSPLRLFPNFGLPTYRSRWPPPTIFYSSLPLWKTKQRMKLC